MPDNKSRINNFNNGIVTDENNVPVSACNDDYEAYKCELENLTNPLSDDYCKYDNE